MMIETKEIGLHFKIMMKIEILKHSDIFQTITVLIYQSTYFILTWVQQNRPQYKTRNVLHFNSKRKIPVDIKSCLWLKFYTKLSVFAQKLSSSLWLAFFSLLQIKSVLS